MKLASKIILTVALTFLGLSIALLVLSNRIFLGDYEKLESEDAARNVSRVISAIHANIESVTALNVDWASWDDTYAFMIDKNHGYVKSTLNLETLAKLRLNSIIYIDTTGKVVYSKSLDHENMKASELPGDIGRHISSGGMLLRNGEDGVAGVLALRDGLFIVSSQPVLTSEGRGPVRGSLIMARLLDSAELERLSATTHMKVSAIPVKMAPEGIINELSRSQDGIVVRPVTDELVEGLGFIKDVYGEGAAIIRVELDRGIYRQGREVILKFLLYLAVVAIVAAVVLIVFIEQTVLLRLKSLGKRVSEIGSSGNLKARIPLSGRDEITDLTIAFNEMMVSLDELDCKRRGAEEELRTANDKLEERVNERTAELHEANLALRDEIAERTRMESIIKEMAFHDHLTGLPNRTLFNDRLSQIISRGAWHNIIAGVVFIDLDRFKVINDTLGHSAGDELIRQFAVKLQEALRDGDTVARMGGDEFTVLLQDLGRADDIAIVIQHIFNAFDKPITICGHDIFVNFSVGVSVYPYDGKDAITLLKNADIAMYQAKGKGGNSFEMYNSSMAEKALDRLTIGNKLRGALERGEFVLYYQPQVEVHTGRIIGAEALIRWNDPDKGLVMPGSFIPLAEESGVIIPMGEWGIYEACAQIRKLQLIGFKDLTVSVNISGRMFTQSNFPRVVAKALQETGFSPKHLILEITESILMTNIMMASEIINEIKELGVRFSIDDFGTGYSSLAYLKSLPISELKIDRSFIRDIMGNLDDQMIVTAIIQLAQSLRLSVLAEGVETEDQLRFLMSRQCDRIQGYLYSKPVPFESFKSILVKASVF